MMLKMLRYPHARKKQHFYGVDTTSRDHTLLMFISSSPSFVLVQVYYTHLHRSATLLSSEECLVIAYICRMYSYTGAIILYGVFLFDGYLTR